MALEQGRRFGAGSAVALLLLAGFTLLGTLLRIEAVPSMYPPDRHQPADVHRYYVSPAESYLEGKGWRTDYRQNFIPPPLQGVFVLAVKWIHPEASYGTMRLVQAWIGGLTILLAFWIGAQLGGTWTGVVSAALVALDPDLIHYVALLLAENNYFFLLFAFLGVFLLALRRENVWLMAASGALLALTSLMKPFPSLLAVGAPIYLLARRRSRASAVHGLAFLLAFLALVAPWILRNHAVHDRWYPISTNGGVALAASNFASLDSRKRVYFEEYIGTSIWKDPEIERAFEGKRDRDGRLEWNEKNSAYTWHALRYIAGNPLHFLGNYATRLVNVFWHTPRARYESWVQRHRYRQGLAVLGLAGLVWFAIAKRREPEWVMVWIFGYYLAFLALFYLSNSGRIQLPTKVLLTFFAAYLPVAAVTAIRARRTGAGQGASRRTPSSGRSRRGRRGAGRRSATPG